MLLTMSELAKVMVEEMEQEISGFREIQEIVSDYLSSMHDVGANSSRMAEVKAAIRQMENVVINGHNCISSIIDISLGEAALMKIDAKNAKVVDTLNKYMEYVNEMKKLYDARHLGIVKCYEVLHDSIR